MTDICALLDHNGYIISSNQGDEFVGSFIGEQAEGIVNLLVNLKVLKKINLKDTQSDCRRIDPRYASARLLLTPAKFVLDMLGAMIRVILRLGVYTFTALKSLFQSVGVSSEYVPNIRTSCDRLLQFFLFQKDIIPEFKSINAKKKSIRCTKGHWCYLKVNYLELVPDTNLVFLKISIHYRCVSMCRKLKLRLERTRIDSDNFCDDLPKGKELPVFVKQKYRRQPSTCFNGTLPTRRRRRRRRVKVKKRVYTCSKSYNIKSIPVWLFLCAFAAATFLV